jgi:hypothetical protein
MRYPGSLEKPDIGCMDPYARDSWPSNVHRNIQSHGLTTILRDTRHKDLEVARSEGGNPAICEL